MATRIRSAGTRTVPEAGATSVVSWGTGPAVDLLRTAGSSTVSLGWTSTLDDMEPVGERKFKRSASTEMVEMWSERVAAEVTISGSITVSAYAPSVSGGWVGRIRFRLYKVTAGGSNIRTLIATQTSAEFSTTGAKVMTVTPSAAVTVVRGERFILIMTVAEHNSTGSVAINVANSDSLSTWIDFTEAITFLDNPVRLMLRRTAVAAIGNFFDLLPVLGGSAATTGVVNTSAGGTEIQWTRTAGGTVLEWISPRVKETFYINSVDYLNGRMYLHESNIAANAAFRIKIFHRAPDGTETLVYTVTLDTELPTVAATIHTWPGASGYTAVFHQAMGFQEDDRIILRLYLTNIGSMGSGRTATLTYDHNVINATGDSYVIIYGVFTFKAEGDPAGSHAIPGGMTTLGLGNDGA